MAHYLAQNRLVPIDKSHGIRNTWLDIINSSGSREYNTGLEFLSMHFYEVSTDLQAMCIGGLDWKDGKSDVYVGESGTLFRFMRLKAWNDGIEAKFRKEGTLARRKIYGKNDVLGMAPEQRLMLDGGTSQWESAAYLCGISQKIANPPPKLQITYDCADEWKACAKAGKPWNFRFDRTILRQAVAYLRALHTGRMEFEAQDAEDFCFAVAMGTMTVKEGEERWPQIRGHESVRPEEMHAEIERMLAGEPIRSKDHRVITARAMREMLEGKAPEIEHPESVRKSWPEFLNFLCQSKYLNCPEALEPV